MSTNDNEFLKDIIDLKTTTASLSELVSRLDSSTSKLTDVSVNIGKLLAIQENRLDNLEKMTEKMSNLLEERRRQVDKQDRQLSDSIQDIEKHFDNRLKNEIIDVKNEIKQQHEKTNKKLACFEKIIWSITGVGSFLIFLLTQLKNIKALFGWQ